MSAQHNLSRQFKVEKPPAERGIFSPPGLDFASDHVQRLRHPQTGSYVDYEPDGQVHWINVPEEHEGQGLGRTMLHVTEALTGKPLSTAGFDSEEGESMWSHYERERR